MHAESLLPLTPAVARTTVERAARDTLYLTIGLATAALGMALWIVALADSTAPGVATGLSFVATLLTLALLEHWFLILPIKLDALWDWGMGSRRESALPATK